MNRDPRDWREPRNVADALRNAKITTDPRAIALVHGTDSDLLKFRPLTKGDYGNGTA